MELLAVWLQIETTPDQLNPTWKNLCDAVSTVDKTLAKKMAQEHLISRCSECTGIYTCVIIIL